NDLKIQANGYIPVSDYQQGAITGTLAAKNIQANDYQIDALNGQLSLQHGNVKIELVPIKKGQRIIAEANIKQVWDEAPFIAASVKGSGINPAVWAQDESYRGHLNFEAHISGTGWMPEQKLWHYRLQINQSELMGQKLAMADISGRFNDQKFNNQSEVVTQGGAL